MNKLRSVELYQDDQRKLIAIESVELSQSKFKNGGHLYGSITPLAVVICTPEGNEVLVMNDETNTEQLKDLISELE